MPLPPDRYDGPPASVVYPEPPWTEWTVDDYRSAAVCLLTWACVGGKHDELGLRYTLVTEGRDPATRYSSCADLYHWLCFRLGLRCPWINRAEHRGFVDQVNVYRLVEAARAYGGIEDWPLGSLQRQWNKRCNDDNRANPGDLIIVANRWPSGEDSHIVCILERLARGYRTAEFGLPGGAVQERESFKRTQRIWLPLDALIQEARTRGELVAPDPPPDFELERAETDPCPPPGAA